jgi:hypothetical protein
MMHSATQLADTVMSRSVYNRETTVKHSGQDGVNVLVGGRASICGRVLQFERPRGIVLQCVSSSESAISLDPYMKKFIPNICHISQFKAFLCATIASVKIYSGPPIIFATQRVALATPKGYATQRGEGLLI